MVDSVAANDVAYFMEGTSNISIEVTHDDDDEEEEESNTS